MTTKIKTKMMVRAEQAARKHGEAEKLARRRPVDFCESILNPAEAERKFAETEALLTVDSTTLVGSPTTEMVSAVEPGEQWTPVRDCVIDTLSEPTSISIAASEQRASAAAMANVLSPALDAMQTAGASNSLERMLCHQLAAVHFAGMEMMARANASNLPPLEHARLMNSVARMFDTYANGTITLQKLKSGGRQVVTVQYQQVNVGAGGKAVVAGRVPGGSGRKGRGERNGGKTS
jgi:hypothetical protein